MATGVRAIPGTSLLVLTDDGLFCPAGGFHIDPWRPVGRAITTHAHSDHARPGSAAYLVPASGAGVLAERVGTRARIETVAFGERLAINGVTVSLHPAAHVLGSAQVRLAKGADSCLVTGDYKTTPDPSCEAFEPVTARVFISESTFGLPVFRWPRPEAVREEILAWWAANRAAGRTSVLFTYALGKAQRVLALLRGHAIGPLAVHGSIRRFLPHYEAAGRRLAPAPHLTASNLAEIRGEGLVLAPASVQGTPWLRRLGACSLAFASGWMQVRGNRRRRSLDRGFVLSDHVDWPQLLAAIEASGAAQVGLTHGFSDTVARWIRERGGEAFTLPTRFTGEASAEDEPPGPGTEDGDLQKGDPGV